MLPLMMEVSRPVAFWPQRPALRLPQFFSPGYAIPRERYAPKNSGTAVFLFVAALRVRPAPGRLCHFHRGCDWRG